MYFFGQSMPYDLLAFTDGEVHVFEEEAIFPEITEDVRVAGGVLEEFIVLDHLEIVIVLVNSIERNLVGRRHLTTWTVTHYKE
jgi:hypothetical protein